MVAVPFCWPHSEVGRGLPYPALPCRCSVSAPRIYDGVCCVVLLSRSFNVALELGGGSHHHRDKRLDFPLGSGCCGRRKHRACGGCVVRHTGGCYLLNRVSTKKMWSQTTDRVCSVQREEVRTPHKDQESAQADAISSTTKRRLGSENK